MNWKLTFSWKWWLYLKLVSYKSIVPSQIADIFSLFLYCHVRTELDLGSSLLVHIGKMNWTRPQFPGSKSALLLDISFTHLFLLILSFWEHMPHYWSHIWGYYQFIWAFAIIVTCSYTASIMFHLCTLRMCFFLFIFTKKITNTI